MYMVLAYLTLFRYDDIGARRFRGLLGGLDVTKMHILLRFLFDREAVKTWLLDEWCRALDREYVERELLGGLDRHAAEVRAWLAETHAAAFGATEAAGGGGGGEADAGATDESAGKRKRVKPPTVPHGPALTAPRARLAPEPIRIEQVAAAKPVRAAAE